MPPVVDAPATRMAGGTIGDATGGTAPGRLQHIGKGGLGGLDIALVQGLAELRERAAALERRAFGCILDDVDVGRLRGIDVAGAQRLGERAKGLAFGGRRARRLRGDGLHGAGID